MLKLSYFSFITSHWEPIIGSEKNNNTAHDASGPGTTKWDMSNDLTKY